MSKNGTLQTEVELKALHSRRDKLKGELNQAVQERNDLNKKIRDTEERLKAVENQIRHFSEDTESIVVSEHAMLRYLERVQGVKREDIRKAILPPNTEAIIKKLKSGTFPVDGQDFKLRAKNGTIITLIAPEEE
jgi:predicted  nucleic acid-binding Zn-ribbon protein